MKRERGRGDKKPLAARIVFHLHFAFFGFFSLSTLSLSRVLLRDIPRTGLANVERDDFAHGACLVEGTGKGRWRRRVDVEKLSQEAMRSQRRKEVLKTDEQSFFFLLRKKKNRTGKKERAPLETSTRLLCFSGTFSGTPLLPAC